MRTGIETLVARHADWLRRARIGLVSHPAAVAGDGTHASCLLASVRRTRLAALFGPEHGYLGLTAAGGHVHSRMHPSLRIPVFSLYGKDRKPSPRMLDAVDLLVFDVQDIGVRPYTYVATLRNVMEAAAECGKKLIVADRPIPLPSTVDGPVTDPAFTSFVSSIPAPMVYGMTPGETARWLRKKLALDLDLAVAPMSGYRRSLRRGPGWPPWIPPSPALTSWESALCYPATVFCEAFACLDHGRGTGMAFQVFGAPWIHSAQLVPALRRQRLPGVSFHPHLYTAQSGKLAGRLLDGVRLVVTDPDRFRPARTSLGILTAIGDCHGSRRLWSAAGTRPEFFDLLLGTDRVRLELRSGTPAGAMAREWRKASCAFLNERERALLYP